MTYDEAKQYVLDHDDDTAEPKMMEEVFAALYDRPADAEDRRDGLWSLCCAEALPMEE
jgi:hypothetical protein